MRWIVRFVIIFTYNKNNYFSLQYIILAGKQSILHNFDEHWDVEMDHILVPLTIWFPYAVYTSL